MQLRTYHTDDLPTLRAIHATQGFDYPLPDLTNPLFLTKLVLTETSEAQSTTATASAIAQSQTNEPGKIVGAAFLRLTAEAYLLLDPKFGAPQDRWRALLNLHAAAERDAWQRGLEDVHAWLPPPIAQKFGKRIARLGWIRDDLWTPYCKRLTAPP